MSEIVSCHIPLPPAFPLRPQHHYCPVRGCPTKHCGSYEAAQKDPGTRFTRDTTLSIRCIELRLSSLRQQTCWSVRAHSLHLFSICNEADPQEPHVRGRLTNQHSRPIHMHILDTPLCDTFTTYHHPHSLSFLFPWNPVYLSLRPQAAPLGRWSKTKQNWRDYTDGQLLDSG